MSHMCKKTLSKRKWHHWGFLMKEANLPRYKKIKVHLNTFFFLTNIQFPLRHPSLWWKCPYRFKNNTKILFSLRINFSLLHILHARVFLKTQSKRKKEMFWWFTLIIGTQNLTYFNKRVFLFLFLFLRESNEPLETRECATVNYFSLIKDNNWTIWKSFLTSSNTKQIWHKSSWTGTPLKSCLLTKI